MNTDDIFAKPDPFAASAELRYMAKLLSKYGLGQASDWWLETIAKSYALRKGLSTRRERQNAEQQSIVVAGPDGVHLVTVLARSVSGALRGLVLWIFQQEGVSSLDELEVRLDLEVGRTA